MVSATVSKKADRWFEATDINGDGQIQRSDLRALGERILTHFGHNVDSAKGRKLLQAYDRSWEYIASAMDMDRDEAISKEEFRVYMDEKADRKNADKALRPVTDAEFAAADVDDDGYLSRDEYAELLRAFNVKDQDAHVGAEAIDTDRDGRISPEEYFRACRDLFAGGENLGERSGQVFGRL
ncbi:EF-hand domain-containing protein [Actinocorallia aurantiaca]|uniref:EF-hand domain-containing protein n=1 Tax=Actinocorallia aurantiaca TaxID=46204 RepID=A0ABP6GBI9_9ACTN